MRSFGSDNHAGVHPDVLAAVVEANAGHAPAYGADPWTARAEELFRRQFGPDAEAFCAFNGTAANVLALAAVLRPHHAVLCAQAAHIVTDECGAPGRFLGSTLIALPAPEGRLDPDTVARAATRGRGDEHHVQPRVVSITQSTELGTVYPPAAVRDLVEVAHAHGLLLHVDGARLGNAAAALGVGLAEATTGCGVDLLSFGGTKNGALGAEAVVFLRPGLAADFRFVRKQAMQLASKMRYVSAQFVALLDGDLWRRNAAHANAMAGRLAAAVRDVPGVRITRPVQVNAVFALLPAAAVAPLQAAFPFYVWDSDAGEVRWMCSWDTTAADVDAFAAALRAAVGAAAYEAARAGAPVG